MMNKVNKLWVSLEQDNTLSSGLLMKRYSAEIVPDIFVALLMPEKTKSIAFRISNKLQIDDVILDNLKDIKIHMVQDIQNKSKQLLVISLLEFQFYDIFSVLCEDLILSVANESSDIGLFKALLHRLEQWKELFEKVRNKPLTLSSQIGLFGELYVLNKFIDIVDNHLSVINLWKGPESSIRDFEKNLWALEVKTTSTNNHQKLFINNERQLDSTHLNDLFLFHLSIELRDNFEINLNSIIETIKHKISENTFALSLFDIKLIKSGYLEKDTHLYEKQGFMIRSENIYQVFDNFPRIEEKDLRLNVGNVKYSIIPPDEEKYKVLFDDIVSKSGVVNEN